MSVPEPTIQIVDDDESFLAAISRLLRASGFEVKTYSSASDLLAACDADAPGCVLADLQMPGMNGLQVAGRLRRAGWSTPIVFLTIHDDEGTVHATQEAGGVGFVLKALLRSDLVVAVREACAGRRYRSLGPCTRSGGRTD